MSIEKNIPNPEHLTAEQLEDIRRFFEGIGVAVQSITLEDGITIPIGRQNLQPSAKPAAEAEQELAHEPEKIVVQFLEQHSEVTQSPELSELLKDLNWLLMVKDEYYPQVLEYLSSLTVPEERHRYMKGKWDSFYRITAMTNKALPGILSKARSLDPTLGLAEAIEKLWHDLKNDIKLRLGYQEAPIKVGQILNDPVIKGMWRVKQYENYQQSDPRANQYRDGEIVSIETPGMVWIDPVDFNSQEVIDQAVVKVARIIG